MSMFRNPRLPDWSIPREIKRTKTILGIGITLKEEKQIETPKIKIQWTFFVRSSIRLSVFF